MKLGEKLSSIGLTPSAYRRELPGARTLRCSRVNELPPGAATGSQRALIRTPEDEASSTPPAIAGPSIVVIR